MAQGRGGMGSHKHGVSGHVGKSPKTRLADKIAAEKQERKRKGIIDPAGSVQELIKRQTQKPRT